MNFDHQFSIFMQTNGLTKRFNQTLCRCLAKVCNEEQSDWDDRIDTVLMGYCASRQASTNHSPYFMLFQQHMRLPIDTECLPSHQEGEEEANIDAIIESLIVSREKVFQHAKISINNAQTKLKETYDRKHQPIEIAAGTQVLLENTAQKQRKGGKLEPAWLGPHTVNRSVGKGLYELLKGDKVVKKKANIGRLKLYKKRARDNSENDTKSMFLPPKKARKVCYVVIIIRMITVFH